jgi:hypothetical protein
MSSAISPTWRVRSFNIITIIVMMFDQKLSTCSILDLAAVNIKNAPPHVSMQWAKLTKSLTMPALGCTSSKNAFGIIVVTTLLPSGEKTTETITFPVSVMAILMHAAISRMMIVAEICSRP